MQSAHGKITEQTFFDSPEIIINIQDLHCNPEVQRNIASLIEEINDKYGISELYVEGAYDNVNTGWIDKVEDKNDRQELLDVLLNSGRLTGAEYYSALNGKYDIIKGIEDERIHKQNIIRLNGILSKQEYYKEKLKDLDNDLVLIQAKYLGSKNRRFDRIIKEYRSGQISTDKYYALLKKYAKSVKEVNLRKYPNISSYIKINELRGKLNHHKIQRQMGIFINVLKEKLPYSVYSDIYAKTNSFTNFNDLCFYADQIVKKYGIELGKGLSDLNLFFEYKRLENAINVKEILEEENNLSQDIRIAFSKDVDEIETAFISYFYEYFKEYLTTSLTAENYKYFVKKIDDFKYLWDKYNYENGLKELESDFAVLDEYYRVNNERDEIFIRQLRINGEVQKLGSSEVRKQPLNLSQAEIQDKLKSSRIKVVITGGFHSDGLKELLKQRKISCITVMPNVTGISDNQKIYEELVKKQAGRQGGVWSVESGVKDDGLLHRDDAGPVIASPERARQSSAVAVNSTLSSVVAKLPSFRASELRRSTLALTLGSTDAQIKYESGRYLVNINGEILEIYKNETTNKFGIKNFPENTAVPNSAHASLITQNVKENILLNIERIRNLSSPAGSAELIYWFVKEISKSGALNRVMLGDGLIWKIASNPEVQQAIKQNENLTLNELSIFPDPLKEIIANHAVLKEKFKDNPIINAVLNTPEFIIILSIVSDKFKIQNYLTPTFNEVKKYFDMLVKAATVRTKIKAEKVTGYKEYGDEVINYYQQRLKLLQAVQTLDAEHYKEAYDSILKSAQTVKSAFLDKKLDLQLLMEVFTREGTLNQYAIPDLSGIPNIGPWYEIISSAGEEFDKKYDDWIRESVDMLISAFPANQRANAAAVRDELIKNTKPHSFSSLIWSPDTAREIFSQTQTFPQNYQETVKDFLMWLTLSSDFEKYKNYGYTDTGKDRKVYMHALEDKDLFKAIYVHELIHALAGMGIIDIPSHIEVLTQIASTLLYDFQNKTFELGEKNAGKIEGELSSEKLDKFVYDLISENCEEFGHKSVRDALAWLNSIKSGNDAVIEKYQRVKGEIIAGILWDRNKNISDETKRKEKSLSDASQYGDTVLAKELSSAPKFSPDIEKRQRIVNEIQQLFRNMTGNENFTLKERERVADNAESRELFTISDDGNTIYYDPLLLDYPDEEAAKALFLEQISVVRFSKPVKVEKGYDTSRFYLLMSTLELIRTRKDNFKGKEVNDNLRKVLYPNPDSESAKRIMQEKSLFAQYIEALLFIARTGRKEDPRIENALVKKALKDTEKAVEKISNLGIIREGIEQQVYETAKTEIWPKLAEIIAKSEEYLKQKKLEELARKRAEQERIQKNIEQMLENMRKQKEQGDDQSGQQQQGQQGQSGQQQGQPGGQSQITPGKGKGQAPTQQQLKEFQKMLENMNEDQKREFDDLMKDLMRDETDNMLNQQQGGYSQAGQQASANEKQGEQYDKMQGQADSAKGKAGKLEQTQADIAQTIEQLQQEIKKLEESAKDIESKSGASSDMSQDTGRLEELSQKLQSQGEELSQEVSDVRSGTQKLKQHGSQLGSGETESAKGLQSSSDDLYQKGKQLDKGVKEFEEKMKELQDKIQKLQELLNENRNIPTQRNQAEEVEKGAQGLQDNVSQIQQLNEDVGSSLQSLQEQLDSYKQEIDQLKQQLGQKQQDASQDKAQSGDSSQQSGEQSSSSQSSQQQSEQDSQEASSSQQKSQPISKAAKEAAQQFKNFANKPNNAKGGGAKVNVKDRTAEIRQSSLSAAEFDEMLKVLEPFRQPGYELAQDIKREMQKTIDNEYLEGMDSGELSDDFSRLADGKIFKKMLIRGSGEHRVMIVIDGSGSMGTVDVASDGKLIDNGSSMYGTMKMLITVLLALKEIDGIEIGVMMYGDIANLLDITKSKDMSDEAIYRMFKALKNGGGGTDDVSTLRSAVERISDGVEGIFKSILHISDGDGYGKHAVEGFYRENAESGVKFVSYGIGEGTSKLEYAYTPSAEIFAMYPQGLAPSAKTVTKAEDLLGETTKFIEDMFREERDETMTFGKNIVFVLGEVLTAAKSIWTGYVKEKFEEYLKSKGIKSEGSFFHYNILGYSQKLVKFFFEGRHGNWLLSDAEIKSKYVKYVPSAEIQKKGGYVIKVSKAPLDLTAPGEDNYVFATVNLNEQSGEKEIIIHESVLKWIKNNGPPAGYRAETFIEEQLIKHELEEYEYVTNGKGTYEDFHKRTENEYKALFELGDAIAKSDDLSGNITNLGYVNRNGKKYLRIKNADQKKPVEVAVDDRLDSSNRVKLYVKENGEWKEFMPGESGIIPDLIGYRVGNSNRINAYEFTAGNRDLLKRMLTAYAKPASDARNTNIWLEGQKGSGKNALSFVFAGLVGIPMRFVSLHANTTQKDISERVVLTQGAQEIEITLENGQKVKAQIPAGITKHVFSEIYHAAQKGELVIIDEVDKVKLEGVMSALNTVLTRERISGLTYDDKFRVIMLSNDHLTGDVSGNDLNRKNRDLLSRMTKIKVGYPEFGEEYERIMDSIYGDVEDGSEQKEMLSNVMTFLITLAGWSRNSQGRDIEIEGGKKIKFPKLSKSISPRTIIKIAKHLHPNNYFNDMEYLGSLIDSAFGVDALSNNERQQFNTFLSQFGKFKRFNQERRFKLGYKKLEDAGFEYIIKNSAVYAVLGKGAWAVEVKTAIEPAKIEEARKRLKYQYQLPGNMLLFWQWMKDINLGENLMVLGVPGTGKTVLTNYFLNTVLGLDAQSMQMNVQSSGADLIGEWGLVNGIQVFKESELVQAMREGKPIIIDEADKPRDETALAVLNNILQDGFIVLPEDGKRSEEERTVYAKEGFFVVTAGNLHNKGGTASTRISGEVMDRHSVYIIEPLPETQAIEMLKRYAIDNGYEEKIPEGFIEDLAAFHYKIMEHGSIKEKPSMRTLEKTIGTLARDPSRFKDVLSVYMEGFSVSNKKIKEWISETAKKYLVCGTFTCNKESIDKFEKIFLDIFSHDGNIKGTQKMTLAMDDYKKYESIIYNPALGFLDKIEKEGYPDRERINRIRYFLHEVRFGRFSDVETATEFKKRGEDWNSLLSKDFKDHLKLKQHVENLVLNMNDLIKDLKNYANNLNGVSGYIAVVERFEEQREVFNIKNKIFEMMAGNTWGGVSNMKDIMLGLSVSPSPNGLEEKDEFGEELKKYLKSGLNKSKSLEKMIEEYFNAYDVDTVAKLSLEIYNEIATLHIEPHKRAKLLGIRDRIIEIKGKDITNDQIFGSVVDIYSDIFKNSHGSGMPVTLYNLVKDSEGFNLLSLYKGDEVEFKEEYAKFIGNKKRHEWEAVLLEFADKITELYGIPTAPATKKIFVVAAETNINNMVISETDGKKYLNINGVSAPIGDRKNKNDSDPRRVKLFLSSEDNAEEVYPENLTEIPETIYYQIGNGEKIPFTFTDGNKDLLKRMLTTYGKPDSDARNTNLWLEGQKGSGKNALSYVFAGLLGVPMRYVNLHANTTQKDISERTVLAKGYKKVKAVTPDGKEIEVEIPSNVTIKQFSEIYEAAKNGELVIIDEVDKVKLDGVLSALNTVLTRDNIKGLKYDSRFRVIVLSNDHQTKDVSGKDLNVKARDFISRLTKIEVPYPSKEEEKQRVMGSVFGDLQKDGAKYKNFEDIITSIVDIAGETRNNKKFSRPLSPRGIFRIAKHLKALPKDKKYLRGLINASYGADTLSANEQKEFIKILNSYLKEDVQASNESLEDIDLDDINKEYIQRVKEFATNYNNFQSQNGDIQLTIENNSIQFEIYDFILESYDILEILESDIESLTDKMIHHYTGKEQRKIRTMMGSLSKLASEYKDQKSKNEAGKSRREKKSLTGYKAQMSQDIEGSDFEYSVSKGIVYVSLGKGDSKVKIPTKFKNTKEAKANLKNQYHISANMVMFWQWMKDIKLSNHIMVLGVPATGKTVLTEYLLNDVLGYNADRQTLFVQSGGTDLLGEWSMDGEQIFKPSLVVEAMIAGKPVIIDEADKPLDETALAALNNILESGFATLPDGTVVHAKKGFFIVTAGNLSDKGGTASTRISGEVMDRHSVYVLDALSTEETAEMLERYAKANNYKMPEGFIEDLVNFHYAILKDGSIKEKPNMRTLEKTIGTLFRGPSRFDNADNIAGVYLEGFSVSNKKTKERIVKIAGNYLDGAWGTFTYNKEEIEKADEEIFNILKTFYSEYPSKFNELDLKLYWAQFANERRWTLNIIISKFEQFEKLIRQLSNTSYANTKSIIQKMDKIKEIVEKAESDRKYAKIIWEPEKEITSVDEANRRIEEILKMDSNDDSELLVTSDDSDVHIFVKEVQNILSQLHKSFKEYSDKAGSGTQFKNGVLTIEEENAKRYIKDFIDQWNNGADINRDNLFQIIKSQVPSFVKKNAPISIEVVPTDEFRDMHNKVLQFELNYSVLTGKARNNEIYKSFSQIFDQIAQDRSIQDKSTDLDILDKFCEDVITKINKLIAPFEEHEKAQQQLLEQKKMQENLNNGKIEILFGNNQIKIGDVSAHIDSRVGDERRVKLFLSGEDNAQEVFPQKLTEIPETIYYQIGDGEKTPFTFTAGNKSLLKRMLATYGKPESDARNTNLWLEGQMGSGKNALSFVFAGLVGIPMRFVSLHANTTQKDISERTVIDTAEQIISVTASNGKKIKVKIPVTITKKQFSEIYEAAQKGQLVIIDEVDKVKLDGVLSALNTVLTRDRISGLKYDPRFRVIVLSNDHQKRDVSGKDLNIRARDFISRLTKIEVPYPEEEEERQMVMGSVFGDLDPGTPKYNDAYSIVCDIVAVAKQIRNNPILTRPLSPRSIFKIARQLKAFPKDREYLYSVINASYGVETLSVNEQKEFKKALWFVLYAKGLNNEYPKDFLMGYGKPEEVKFEFIKASDQRAVIAGSDPQSDFIYVSLGKGDYNVTIRTKFKSTEEAQASLNDQYHIPANMLLFWQWMKNIYLSDNIMVLGVPGTGKTVLTGYLLNDVLGIETDLMQMNVQSSGTDLFGEWGMVNGRMVFKESLVIKAMQAGKPVIIDEVDKPQDETALAALNNILQYGFVTLPDGRTIYAKKGFFIVCTGNLANKGGTASTRISGEVMNRHSVYIVEGLPKDQATEMLKRYRNNNYNIKDVPDEFIEALVDFHEKVTNDPSLPYQPNMRTLEKTIGTAASDPSRYLNIAEVYLEGFSLREPTQELRVHQIAKEQAGKKESFDVLSKRYVLSSESIDLTADILKKLNDFREKFDESEHHRVFTDSEFLGLLKQVSRNNEDVLGIYDYAVKTLQLQDSDTEALKNIENLYFKMFLDEILKYEIKDKSDRKKILEIAGLLGPILSFETLRGYQFILKYYNQKNLDLIEKLREFNENKGHLSHYTNNKSVFENKEFMEIVKWILSNNNPNVLDIYEYIIAEMIDENGNVKGNGNRNALEKIYFNTFKDEILEHVIKSKSDIEKIKQLALIFGWLQDFQDLKSYQSLLQYYSEKKHNLLKKLERFNLECERFMINLAEAENITFWSCGLYHEPFIEIANWALSDNNNIFKQTLLGNSRFQDIDSYRNISNRGKSILKKFINSNNDILSIYECIDSMIYQESVPTDMRGDLDYRAMLRKMDKDRETLFINIFLDEILEHKIENESDRKKIKEFIEKKLSGGESITFETVETEILSKNWEEAAILPENMPKVNVMLNEGKSPFRTALAIGSAMEYAKSFFNPVAFVKAHKNKSGAYKVVFGGIFAGIFAGVLTVVLSGISLPAAAMALTAYLLAGSAANITIHTYIDYRYIKNSQITQAIQKFGAAAIDENGNVRTNIYISDMPKNPQELGLRNLRYKIDGKCVWASSKQGALVLYSEADSEKIEQELNSMLSSRGKIKASEKLKNKFKKLFAEVGVNADFENIKPAASIDYKGFSIADIASASPEILIKETLQQQNISILNPKFTYNMLKSA
ncbi:MAG: AAA family ATPase [Endomicrobia bacterium]|nr:AAA family ATPase [Endomicrobiia bacterium]